MWEEIGMAAVALPNETLLAILGYLESNVLVYVTQVSRRFRALAEYLLYSAVIINDVMDDVQHVPRRTIRWCEAMLWRPHLADSVRRVQIRWSATRTPRTGLLLVCEQLSLAIRTLTGLEHL